MSCLIIANDLQIMMLELVIDKLYLPTISNSDSTMICKTTVIFQIVEEWLSVTSQYNNYITYDDPKDGEENIRGGISVVFAIPAVKLQHKCSNVSIDVHVRKDSSEYFEFQPCYNIGVTRVSIDSLFKGIVKDLKERKEMQKHFNYFHAREPISRSMKDTYIITTEHKSNDAASITIYTRLNYLGKSIITEIESFPNDEFHVREETCEGNPYQCREVSRKQLEIGCWDSDNGEHSPPVKQKDLICMDDVDILQSVRAKAEGALNGIEQEGITMNARGDIGKSEEFTTDSIGGISQGISKRPTKDKKMFTDKYNRKLDEADVAPHVEDESKVKYKDHQEMIKKKHKVKKEKKMKSKMKKKQSNDKGMKKERK